VKKNTGNLLGDALERDGKGNRIPLVPGQKETVSLTEGACLSWETWKSERHLHAASIEKKSVKESTEVDGRRPT